MFIYTLHQYTHLLASIGALLLSTALAAVLYWADHKENGEQKWAVWSKTNAWWIALLAGVCVLYSQIVRKPFSDVELRLQLHAARQIHAACGDWGSSYVYRYMQKPEHELMGDEPWKVWEEIDGFPDLPYTIENWNRVRPMFTRELDHFVDVLQDTLVGFPDLLPDELRLRILIARRDFGHDKSNYHVSFDLLETQEFKDVLYNSHVRGPIRTMKMVCGEATQVYSRWDKTRINSHIGSPSNSD